MEAGAESRRQEDLAAGMANLSSGSVPQRIPRRTSRGPACEPVVGTLLETIASQRYSQVGGSQPTDLSRNSVRVGGRSQVDG